MKENKIISPNNLSQNRERERERNEKRGGGWCGGCGGQQKYNTRKKQ